MKGCNETLNFELSRHTSANLHLHSSIQNMTVQVNSHFLLKTCMKPKANTYNM